MLLAVCFACAAFAGGQVRAKLATSDTTVELRAEDTAPRLDVLAGDGKASWHNRAEETLPAYVERNGKRVPVTWGLVARSASVAANRVSFVYESQQPHLQLEWQWMVRAKGGPVEHRIVVRNLSGDEYWLPVMDSLRLDWEVEDGTELSHLYIDKGAGKP
ncbi:MAG: alpha-galactosidase, partial [Acidobacteriaceae bacterium]